MAGVPAASIAGNMVVTPDMVPPNPAPYDEESKFFNALADDAEHTQQQWKGSNNTRTQSAQSPGFEEGHEKNRQTAADFGRLAGVYRDAASYYSSVADVYRTAHRAQQSAINHANDELRQAKTPAQQQIIIARWHTHARTLTNSAIAEADQKAHAIPRKRRKRHHRAGLANQRTAPQAPLYPKEVETASPSLSARTVQAFQTKMTLVKPPLATARALTLDGATRGWASQRQRSR